MMAIFDTDTQHDDFYGSTAPKAVAKSNVFIRAVLHLSLVPESIWILILVTLISVFVVTRLMSGKPPRIVREGNGKTVWRLPYWIPYYGNSVFLFQNFQAMAEARDRSDGVFSVKVAGNDYVVLSDPAFISSILAQKSSDSNSLNWKILARVFGLSSKEKYDLVQENLDLLFNNFVIGSQRHLLRQTVEQILHLNIPQMISFATAEIDLQQWERSARIVLTSTREVEGDLMTLMRNMLSHAIIPALFGRGLLDKYPNIIQDVLNMDGGIPFFLLGVPFLTPWPGVMSAHMARRRLWETMDEQQKQLDARANREDTDYSWGDLDDVSQLIIERNCLWREHGFDIKERDDLTILWAAVVTAPYLAAWHILHILSTPTLLSKIRAEISPHVKVIAPVKIGTFSSPPSLSISNTGLMTSCPLFRSTLQETLRLSSRDWTFRTTKADSVVISGDSNTHYHISQKGTNLVVPHELYLRNPKHFPSPEIFNPDRFIGSEAGENSDIQDETSHTRLFIDKKSLFGASQLIEEVCASFAAGVLMLWDIEPVVNSRGRKDWKLPKMGQGTGVARPEGDIRVRISIREINNEQ